MQQGAPDQLRDGPSRINTSFRRGAHMPRRQGSAQGLVLPACPQSHHPITPPQLSPGHLPHQSEASAAFYFSFSREMGVQWAPKKTE